MLPRLQATADSQLGSFTRTQALDAGYSEQEIRTRLDAKRWRRLHRGVYTALPTPDLVPDQHLLACGAVVLAAPTLIASHRSAAYVHDLIVVGAPTSVLTFTTAGHGWRGADVHVREGRLDSEDIERMAQLRITSPSRTVVDAAATMPFAHAVALADSALRSGQATLELLRSAVGRTTASQIRAKAARVVAFADGASESAGESLTRVLMDDGRLPKPKVNAWIGHHRVDLLLEDAGVIVEFDGRLKYGDPAALWQEKLRQEWLAQQGFEIVRVTWDDIVRRPQETLARIHAAVARARSRRRIAL